jgi:hypothetical protein
MIASLLSTPIVFGTSVSEVLQDAGLVTLIAGAYRHLECHQTGCHRFGRFTHGHYKLCARHHPLVPSNGKVTAEHINRIKSPTETPTPNIK